MAQDDRKMERFLVEEGVDGERLDRALSIFMPGISRSQIQNIIASEGVLVNGSPCFSKKHPVREGDILEFAVPEGKELKVEPENIPLDIVFEDEDVLVVNKPKGLVVHPGAGNPDGTLVNAALYHCNGQLSTVNGIFRSGVVHRIDKGTSGLLMMAKTDVAHSSLAQQLADHTIVRGYIALVYNSIKVDEGKIDAPIGRDPKMRLRQKAGLPEGRSAITNYKVMERLGKYTLVEARLETGRTHQIRAHMAYIHHPLVGDPLYGPSKRFPGVSGQLLHAYLLGFVHPVTGEYMEFQNQLPEEFQKVLAKLRGTKR